VCSLPSNTHRRGAAVTILPVDDRIEKPEGVNPSVTRKDHPITRGVDGGWPYLLGFNDVKAKETAEVLATVGEDPLLVTGSFGKDRSVAWTSDISPQLCPKDFVEWPGYGQLWQGIITWAASIS